jgi:drug/metabolite transporter (DMT)-like permease
MTRGDEAARRSSVGRAILWMSGALVSFLLMAVAGRELSAEISIFQVVFFRNAVCLAIVVALLSRVGWHHVRTARLGRHIARNTVHFAGQYGWLFGIASIPLAEVFAIEFTTPIWTALMASAFLGERLTSVRVVAVAFGFVGVLVILRPGLAIVHPAAFAVLGAALGYATTYIITKSLVSVDRPLTILFWMNLVQLPLGLLPSLGRWVWPSAHLLPWIAVIGVVGLSSHYCLSRALAVADATLVVPLDFLRLPLAAVVAWALYAEALDPFVFAGATIIFAGIWLNVRRG